MTKSHFLEIYKENHFKNDDKAYKFQTVYMSCTDRFWVGGGPCRRGVFLVSNPNFVSFMTKII